MAIEDSSGYGLYRGTWDSDFASISYLSAGVLSYAAYWGAGDDSATLTDTDRREYQNLGSGNDSVSLTRSSYSYTGIAATLYGDLGNDYLSASGVGGNALIGGLGNDTAIGGDDSDFLSGGCTLPSFKVSRLHYAFRDPETAARISLSNQVTFTKVYPNVGDFDVLDGRDGDDLMIGVSGQTTATGGSGADVFMPALSVPNLWQPRLGLETYGQLTITDFTPSEGDRIFAPFGMGIGTPEQILYAEQNGAGSYLMHDADGAGMMFLPQRVAYLENFQANDWDVSSMTIGMTPDLSVNVKYLGNFASIYDDEIVKESLDDETDVLGFGNDTYRVSLSIQFSLPLVEQKDLEDLEDPPLLDLPGGVSVDGGLGNDTIAGSDGNDALRGGSGADSLQGGAGDDRIFGDRDGDDIFYDTEGGLPFPPGDDVLEGGEGDDLIQGGGGQDTMTGGSGRDLFVVGDPFWGPATITDYQGGLEGDLLVIEGMTWDTTISGQVVSGNAHLFIDRDGGGVQFEPELAVILEGVTDTSASFINWVNAGEDAVYLPWVETWFGHFGNPPDVIAAADAEPVRYELGGGNDSLDGSLLTETVEAHGGEGRDTLIGGSGMDFLFGGPSADSLQGGDGADLLRGDGAALAEDALLSPSTVILPVLEPSNRSQPGVDTIEGGGGDDIIDGGAEADHLWGGTGADTFYYDSVRDFGDFIHDFDAGFGGDKIVVDRLIRLAPGTTQLDYFRLEQVGDDVNVLIDLDAGGTEFGEQLLAVLLDTAAGSVSLQAYFGQVWIGQEWRDNTAPVAEDDDIAIVEDQQAIGMLPLAFDDDADPVRYTLETQAANGIAEVTRDGLYRYTPEPGFAGMDSFQYTVSDYRGSNTYTVSVDVASTNNAPTASDANLQAQEDTELSGQLPAATDLDGDDVTYALASGASQGTAVVNADGSFTYLADSDYYGADSFEFTVSDGEAENTYTVTLDVAQVDDTITGTAGDDLLSDDTNGPALLQGLGGNDTLEGGSGDDTVAGGEGVDLLRFAAQQSEVQLVLDAGPSGAGTAMGTGSAAALGMDSFTGIERIAYDDAVWALDTRAPGENAYDVLAMHNAAFNALPTPEVLGQFLPVADASGDLADVAQAMLDFYVPGGVGDFELVLHLYVQILLPPGNALGQQDLDLIDFYASLIGPGQQFPTQADLCAAAALLPENTSEFVGLIADGVALPSDWYAA